MKKLISYAELAEKLEAARAVVCVVGAGYVGLPLSDAFARTLNTISYDIDAAKISHLTQVNTNPRHIFTSNPARINEADFICISVPTPITDSKKPDMSYVKSAAETVGRYMRKGAVVILESSVVPGVTQQLLQPVLAEQSGFEYGSEFRVAYSPERINPGDNEHNVDRVTKIVSADDEDTLKLLVTLYHHVTPSLFQAADIMTAEAAKLGENTQRDLNIALVNELSMMFAKIGLNTNAVLDAASSKWNFQRYSPGLVGGYCIPVVPHFLISKAAESGYRPQLIATGRLVNDSMPKFVAELTKTSLFQAGKALKGTKVLIMGVTYKENVEDTRETPVREVIRELQELGIEVLGFDPVAKDPASHFNIKFIDFLKNTPQFDGVILNIAHDAFKAITPEIVAAHMNPEPGLIDLRGMYDIPATRQAGFIYRRL